jgi:predicted nucleic acid-binding protein
LIYESRFVCPNPRPLLLETHRTAHQICTRYGFGIYDGLIIASALEADCATLYTEDLQHGQVVEGVRIENPFRGL